MLAESGVILSYTSHCFNFICNLQQFLDFVCITFRDLEPDLNFAGVEFHKKKKTTKLQKNVYILSLNASSVYITTSRGLPDE